MSHNDNDWETILTERLRFLIGDFDPDPLQQTYSDTELTKFIAIAAIHVISTVSHIKPSFVINTHVPTIEPNPTGSGVAPGISNLFVLKAACFIAQSEHRKNLSKFGIKFKDDVTSWDATTGMSGANTILSHVCEAYDDAALDWEKGNLNAGRGVIGPHGDGKSYQYGVGRYK